MVVKTQKPFIYPTTITVNLKESKMGVYVRVWREKRGEGQMMQLYYNLNKITKEIMKKYDSICVLSVLVV